MHAGLNLPDGTPDVAAGEVRQVADEMARLDLDAPQRAPVALMFDYEAKWLLGIQHQGVDFDYLRLAYESYVALRAFGVDVDIISPAAPLDGFSGLVIPSLPIISDDLVDRLAQFSGQVLVGPRSGSKTERYQIPDRLPPGPLQKLLPIRITRVESLRPGILEAVDFDDVRVQLGRWREFVESDLEPEARFKDGAGAVYQHGRLRYLAGWPGPDMWLSLMARFCRDAGVATQELPHGLRLRRRGGVQFAFNYGSDKAEVPAPQGRDFLLGQAELVPGEVAAWKSEPASKA
jgi:beta-galactosidase